GRDLPPPGPADWRAIGDVRHVFSHFSLTLTVMIGDLTGNPERGQLIPLRQIDRDALPGLMRKVWDMAQSEIAA
ncbi:MAG: NUDIX domain-containing protein, partial [Paracoccus sp. (in: a-proteobacteria)]|nr:NUDIX domain-containing protein [Paracoccus sp. (in: a-proteobacteria)]